MLYPNAGSETKKPYNKIICYYRIEVAKQKWPFEPYFLYRK